MSWYRRLLNLVRPNRLARDIQREMDFHLQELVDRLVSEGMSARQARREAKRRFGNRADLRERVRDADVVVWLDSLLADLRYAGRALWSTPAFTLVAVLSLGLGIGANTAIFSLINAVLLRSVPVQHPEQLVQLSMTEYGTTFTNPQWEEIRDRQDVLRGVLAFSNPQFDLTAGGVVRRVSGGWVSGDYFNVLGVRPAVGRLLGPGDDVRGCAGTAVLSYGFWQREYGGAGSAVGRTISLDGHPFEIVGVVQQGFAGIIVGRPQEVFAPLCTVSMLREGRDVLDARSTWFLNVFGRLRPGSTVGEARPGLAALAPRVFEATIPQHWTADEQEEYAGEGMTAKPGANGLSYVRSSYQQALYVLLMVVGVVLLIACANVAQLLMARAAAREDEMAIRLALGSGSRRLARQLLTESLVLAFLGAAVGVVFARWSSALVVGWLAQGGRPVALDLSLDLRVLGFTIAMAVVTGVLFGLAPAWRAGRVDPQTAMRGGGRGTTGSSHQRFARGIVAGQVALSLVLVTAAGLLVGSFRRLSTVDPGFRSDGVLVVTTDWSRLEMPEERKAGFPSELVERIRGLAGVWEASASLLTPISGTFWNDYVAVEGYDPPNPREALVWFNGVSDGYLDALGTRLLEGRDFTPADRDGSPRVAIVNQTMARQFYGKADPVGRMLATNVHDSIGPAIEVIGLMEDSKYGDLDEDPRPIAYIPLSQAEMWQNAVELVIRADGPPGALIPGVTRAMEELDPAIAVEYTTLEDQISNRLARPRLLATLSGFFGALALLLAVIGLYGTMAYSVTRRRAEIGVRIAIGAPRAGILRMVAGEAGKVIGIGVVLGVGLALAATRVVASFLYGVTAFDPATLALSALILGAVALAAGLMPAWRAAGVDPMITLREE